MVRCARCDRDVDAVESVTPDVMSEKVIDSINHGKEDLAEKGSEMKVCAECMDELRGE
jgi:hypothetical protein